MPVWLYAIAGLMLSNALTAGAGYWQYRENMAGRAMLAASEANRAGDRIQFDRARAALAESIETMKRQQALNQVLSDRLAAELRKAEERADDVAATYDDYRNRIGKAALAKPGLVGRLATRASARLFDDVARATDPDRDGDGAGAAVPPAAAGQGAPAGADRDRGADAGRDAPAE